MLTGTPLWADDLGGGGGNAEGNAVAVAPDGSVVVVGNFGGALSNGTGTVTSVGGEEGFVAKYSAAGAPLWLLRLGAPSAEAGADSLYPYGAAVDASGDILVTGSFTGTADFGGGATTSAGGADVFLIKLSSSGSYAWGKTFGDPQYQSGLAVSVDSSSNVYLVGGFAGTISFGGPDLSDGNTGGSLDSFLAKFTSGGSFVWSNSFENTGQVNVTALGVEPTGVSVVAGWFDHQADFGTGNVSSLGVEDIFLAEFDENGVAAWAKTFGDTSASDYATGVGLDSSGNVFLTGYYNDTLNLGVGAMTSAGDAAIFLAKFDPTGSTVWSNSFGNSDCLGLGGPLAVDSIGDVTIAGGLYGSANFGGGDVTGSGGESAILYMAKYRSSGAYAWGYGGTGASNPYSTAVALAANPSADVLATGSFQGTLNVGATLLSAQGTQDAFLADFSP